MVQENEIVMLLLGVGVFLFALANRLMLKRLQSWKTLFTGYVVLLTGCVFTVLEGFFWEELLNYLEHMCYAGSSLFVAHWCWKVFGSNKEAK